MSCFGVAWDSIAKAWSPSWRDIAQYELSPISNIEDFDMFTHKFLGDGQDFMVYAHPQDSRFAVKVPKDNSWEAALGYDRQVGQDFYRVMERLGFPIASEMTMTDNYDNPYYGGGEKQPGCWFDFWIGKVHFVLIDGRYYRESPKLKNPSM